MATISNTPRPGYVWDSTDNVWYPIGVGGHSHPDYITQATAISPTTVDAKGDLLVGSAADTISRLAVGNSGEQIVADSSTSTGLRYQGSTAAGKNFVINGAFDNWQRGTTFTNPADGAFTADRMSLIHDGTGATRTISRQALAPASISGFDSQYFYRYAVSAAGTGNTYQRFGTKIENVQNLTGTVTVSFWAKADASRTVSFQLDQYYGSGGSAASVGLSLSGIASVTTSWQRFSATGTLASISGKTVGDGSYVYAYFAFPANTALTIDIAGFQIENGSVATQFSRSAGTIQGELAACQRYYYRIAPNGTFRVFTSGQAVNANDGFLPIPFPVQMRIRPTALEQSGTAGHYSLLSSAGTRGACSSVPTYDGSTTQWVGIITAFATGHLVAGNCTTFGAENASAYLGWSAEL